VRPGDDAAARELAERLAGEQCDIVVNDAADAGMGTSLACGVRAAPDARGWIIALADMPAIEPETIRAVAAALAQGAMTAAPFVGDARGHPVGFASSLRESLLALTGDAGARALLARHPPQRIAVGDDGVLYDVDQP
jgi:molybdenum cofactor cytidylyltransferase